MKAIVVFFCSAFPLHPYPLVVEIIGAAFRTGFRIFCYQAVHHYPPIFTLATLVTPHSHITLRNLPGPMVGPLDSIGCRLSEILSDPARPTSVHHHRRELPAPVRIFLSPNVGAVTAFETTSIPPRRRAEFYRDSTTSHISSTRHQQHSLFIHDAAVESPSSQRFCKKEANNGYTSSIRRIPQL